MRAFVSLLLALVASGCTSTRALTTGSTSLIEQAQEFNQAAVTSDRQMILQNVLRARDRESLSFARLSAFSDTMQRQVQGGFTSTLNEGPGNDVLGPNLTIMGNAAPHFEVSVPNTQEFNRAIHNSIDSNLYNLFLQQDWQPALIHLLFIDRISLGCQFVTRLHSHLVNAAAAMGNDAHAELERAATGCASGAKSVVLYNSPEDWEAASQFHNWLRILMADGENYLQLCPNESVQAVGDPLSGRQVVQAAQMLAAQQVTGGLVWTQITKGGNRGRWQLGRPVTTYTFGLGCGADTALASDGVASPDNPSPSQPSAGARNGTIYVRSLEGIIYYLGQVLRVESGRDPHVIYVPRLELNHPTGQYDWRAALVSDEDCLFGVVDHSSQPSLIGHQHGHTYMVPYGEQQCANHAGIDRSQQVIELALQIIGMYQTRQDLPVTPVVRLQQ